MDKKKRQAIAKGKRMLAEMLVAGEKPAVEGTVEKLPKMKAGQGGEKKVRVPKPKPTNDCACGCGGQTKRTWFPGHDARANGWAIRIEKGLMKLGEVPENEQKGAIRMLKERKEGGLTKEKVAPKATKLVAAKPEKKAAKPVKVAKPVKAKAEPKETKVRKPRAKKVKGESPSAVEQQIAEAPAPTPEQVAAVAEIPVQEAVNG